MSEQKTEEKQRKTEKLEKALTIGWTITCCFEDMAGKRDPDKS